jgi:hypothetical protein
MPRSLMYTIITWVESITGGMVIMNSINLRGSRTRILVVALVGVALLASMLFINPGTTHAEGWEKIFKFKDGKDTYVGGLSYKGTFVKGEKVRGVLGVKSADSKVTVPGTVKGLKVKVVELSNVYYGWDGVNLKTKASNIKSVNLKKVTGMTYLWLTGSKVTKLDLSKNKKLKNLYLYQNKKLKSLDLSKNTNLISVHITGAKSLKSIDFSHNKKLKDITLDKGTKVKGLSADKYKKINWE